MTRFIITDPSEAAPNADGQWSGYWSLNIEENHELLASINLAGAALPDVDDPEELAEVFDELGEAFRALDDLEEGDDVA